MEGGAECFSHGAEEKKDGGGSRGEIGGLGEVRKMRKLRRY